MTSKLWTRPTLNAFNSLMVQSTMVNMPIRVSKTKMPSTLTLKMYQSEQGKINHLKQERNLWTSWDTSLASRSTEEMQRQAIASPTIQVYGTAIRSTEWDRTWHSPTAHHLSLVIIETMNSMARALWFKKWPTVQPLESTCTMENSETACWMARAHSSMDSPSRSFLLSSNSITLYQPEVPSLRDRPIMKNLIWNAHSTLKSFF